LQTLAIARGDVDALHRRLDELERRVLGALERRA
jgi:hypothetical protein